MAGRRPLLPNDAKDHMVQAMGPGPGAESLLHLRVEPLFRRDPALHKGKIDPAEGGSTL